jgi:hypothetical protein
MLQRVIVESARDKIDACLFLQEQQYFLSRAAPETEINKW